MVAGAFFEAFLAFLAAFFGAAFLAAFFLATAHPPLGKTSERGQRSKPIVLLEAHVCHSLPVPSKRSEQCIDIPYVAFLLAGQSGNSLLWSLAVAQDADDVLLRTLGNFCGQASLTFVIDILSTRVVSNVAR